MASERSSRWVLLAELLILGALVSGITSRYRNPAIHTDESYHLMCAESINAGQGLPMIGGRIYTRAWVYSYSVAYAQKWFGTSVEASRLPAIVCGILLVLGVFAWVRREAGRVAAWSAGLLMGLSFFTFETSHFCRFYTMYALVVGLMIVCVYEATRFEEGRRWWINAAWGMAAVALSPLSYHLQKSALVVWLGLATWVSLVVLWHTWTSKHVSGRGKLLAIGGIAAGGLVCAGLLTVFDLWGVAWGKFTWQPYWADPNHNSTWEYVQNFWSWYGWWWALTPVFLVAVMTKHARLAWYGLVFLAVTLTVMSLSRVHAMRYIFMITPMIFVLWGVGMGVILTALHGWATRLIEARVSSPRLRIAGAAMCGVALALVLTYAAYRTPAYFRTLQIVRTPGPHSLVRYGDYATAIRAVEQSQPDALLAPIVLASPAAKAQLFFPGREIRLLGFADDGRPEHLMSTTEQLRSVMASYPCGLIVVDQGAGYWRDPRFVTDELADLVEADAVQLPAPPEARVKFFRWDHTLTADVNP